MAIPRSCAALFALSCLVFAADPITRLSQRLDSGQARLEFVPGGLGYLPSLLHQLDVGREFLEIAALDPVKGMVLYTLSTAQSGKPRFVPRDSECASCHGYSGRPWPNAGEAGTSREYARLSAEDRRAILGILRETKPDLPEYWRE